MTFSNNQQDAT